jgi:hypothetical protein
VAASVPIAIEIPFFAHVLSLAPLDVQGWSIAVGAAFLSTGWGLFVGTRRRGAGASAPGA